MRKPIDLDKLDGNFIEKTAWQINAEKLNKVIAKHFNTFPRKVGILSDIHLPWHGKDLIKQATYECIKADCTDLVIGGDFADCHSLAFWDKNIHVSLKRELEACAAQLRVFSKNFKRVLLITANHEERYMTTILRNLNNPELVEVMGTPSSLLEKIVEVSGVKNAYVSEQWYVQIGDTIIAHPLSGGKIAGGLARDTCTTLIDIGEEFKNLIVAHTHGNYESQHLNKHIIETPALCSRLDYMYRVSSGRAWVSTGYTIVDFDKNGNGTPELHVFKKGN